MGLALSDEDGNLAFPYTVIQNKERARIMRAIRKVIKNEGVTRIVIGMPRALSGDDTAETKIVLRFMKEIKKQFSLPVMEENEMFTTRLAREGSTNNIDASAAALILQSYLDKHK